MLTQAEDIDFEETLAVFNSSYKHLVDLIRDDGAFFYQYDCVYYQVSERYNILRHAGCVWILNELFHPRFEDCRSRIDKSIDFLVGKAEVPPNGIGRCIPEGQFIKVGANGLALLAICSCDQAMKYRSLASDLVSYIISQQREDLDFIHKVEMKTGLDTGFVSEYYTGEVLFALLRYSMVFSDAKVFEFAERALLALVKRGYGIKQSSHWMMYAVNCYISLSNSPLASAYVATFNDHLLSSDLYRYAGRGTPIACRTEALIASIEICDMRSELAHYRATLCSEVKLNKKIQLEYFLPSGGFVGTLKGTIVRIDFIQHHLPAFSAQNYNILR